jgi:hypothetical protein
VVLVCYLASPDLLLVEFCLVCFQLVGVCLSVFGCLSRTIVRMSQFELSYKSSRSQTNIHQFVVHDYSRKPKCYTATPNYLIVAARARST